jgi:hypothetical protein
MKDQRLVDRIIQKIQSGDEDYDSFIAELESEGYTKEDVQQATAEIRSNNRQELFNQVRQKQKVDEYAEVALFVVMMIAILPPIFGATEMPIYFFAAIAAGIAGFFGFKKSPIAGTISSALCVFFFKYAHHLYFANRTSFIKIEMLIPIIMAAIPTYILYLILSSIFKPNNN